ncbi:nitrogenase component 1 [Aetokthonos hydrillicola]|uniref:nitrogenase component 1 n=1 Tax=Aetokthonos hydrillicola TaxID=1550245 RepID=UPI0028778177|nr:nitrogenase component 1 [Aetokthonos hydrillicola]
MLSILPDSKRISSLLFTEPVDLLIGNTYGKYLWRDCKVPLVRIGYPIMDRHHLHRYATIGYEGTINLLNWVVNTIFEEIDRNTNIPSKTDISYDLIR